MVAASDSGLKSQFRIGGEGNPDFGTSEGHEDKPAISETSRLRAGGSDFVSYSHVDSAVRDKLEVHLAALKRDGVVTWYDGDMQAGDALDTEIARALRQSHLFVALLSPDYLASHYCWKLEY